MAVACLRGAVSGAGFEGTLALATPALIALAAVGLVVGWVAEATVDESVRTRLQAQIDEASGG